MRLAAAPLVLLGCLAGGRPLRAAPAAEAEVVFQGMCDASGAVVLAGGRFAVADDEDNVLRVYDADRGGAPLRASDLSPALELPHKKRAPETDLEAATRLGDRALWLTSHGRNSKGKLQPSRLRFFATTTPADGALALVGRPYTGLRDDLLAAPPLARFGLERAAQLPPKQEGGLNIEGMTARPDGRSVLIGFRSPIPGGRALVLPLLNPEGLTRGERARLESPLLLDLGGLGIRALSRWRGRYLVIGGAVDSERPSRLYTWDGTASAPRPVPSLALGDLNPEGFFSPADRDRVLLLSDDGTRAVDGQPCKDLEHPAAKRFRGRWVRIP